MPTDIENDVGVRLARPTVEIIKYGSRLCESPVAPSRGDSVWREEFIRYRGNVDLADAAIPNPNVLPDE